MAAEPADAQADGNPLGLDGNRAAKRRNTSAAPRHGREDTSPLSPNAAARQFGHRLSGMNAVKTRLAEREGFEPSVELQTPHSLSRRAPSASRSPLRPSVCQPRRRLRGRMAEAVGFEPTELSPGGFQDRCLRPLGHASATRGREGKSAERDLQPHPCDGRPQSSFSGLQEPLTPSPRRATTTRSSAGPPRSPSSPR